MQGVKVKSNQTNKYSSKVQIPKEYTEVHSQSNCTLLLPTSEESRLKKTNLPQNGSNKVGKKKTIKKFCEKAHFPPPKGHRLQKVL